MKSSDVKTEKDIDKLLRELEMKKFAHMSRRARCDRINGMIVLGALFLIVLLGVIYPSIRGNITASIGDILHNVVNWYILLGFIVVLIIRRIVLYRAR